jgi:hypothetical protein
MQWTAPAGKILVIREPARFRLGHGSALRSASKLSVEMNGVDELDIPPALTPAETVGSR